MKDSNTLFSDRMAEHSTKRCGLTLVESMIALAIFGLFISCSCFLIMRTRQMCDAARSHYTAINIAKNYLEKARTFDFDQLTSFAEDKVVINASGIADLNGNYRRTTVVTSIKSNLVKLTFTIEIRDRKTLEFEGESEYVSSYVANYWERP